MLPPFARRDGFVIAALVGALVVTGTLVALPEVRVRIPDAGPIGATPTPVATVPPAVTYREGVVGAPVSITPVTARTRADRTLVGLVFSGLVRAGPDGTYLPDLAASWTADENGRAWAFTIRPDATWQDGAPVTAEDVVFTIDALKSPEAAGGASAAWAEVTATATGPREVRFTLDTPVAGFLAALCQPLVPAHLLEGLPFAALPGSDFARLPVGTGPFALVELGDARAVLEARSAPPTSVEATPGPTPDSLAPIRPGPVAARPTPYLERIELHFYESEQGLLDAFANGEIDGASGLTPGAAAALRGLADVEPSVYPTTTLTTALLNLRTTHPEFRDARVRRGLLAALDREAIVRGVLGSAGGRADALIPPSSWAFDLDAIMPVGHDPDAAVAALEAAGWTRPDGRWRAPRAEAPYVLELLTVPPTVNPRLAAIAERVRAAWEGIGFVVSVVELPTAELAVRLRDGAFTAAVVDIATGREPDLYPLLASTQVLGAGTNLAAYQDPVLDRLLERARRPAPAGERIATWGELLEAVDERMPLLPIAWVEETFWTRGLTGHEPRLLVGPGDRFGDVLAWRLAATR